MKNIVQKILDHEDTRTVPCSTVKSALNADELHFEEKHSTAELIDFLDSKWDDKFENFTERYKEFKKNHENKTDREMTIAVKHYPDEIRRLFGNTLEPLANKSLITPRNVSKIYPNMNSGWKKDPSSGRNYYYVFENPLISVINKGGDMLQGSKFRKLPPIGVPMMGGATLEELSDENRSAIAIQEHSLKIQGRTTWAPMPLQLNELTNYVLETGEIVPYIDYFGKIMEMKEIATCILFTLMQNRIDPMSFPKEFEKKPFVWAVEQYAEIAWPHGTYLYFIKGLNTRLIDVEKLGGVRNLERAISLQYPDCRNNKEVCAEFMRRLGEYHGIRQGMGFNPAHESKCHLIDTTMGGVKMDIGELTLSINQESYISNFWSAKTTCHYVYNLFFPESKNNDFLQMFEDSYVKTLIDYMTMSNRGIEQEVLRGEIAVTVESIIEIADSLITANDLELKTGYYDLI
jgi:hypothetical protein